MALRPDIILAGRSPNVMGSLMQGAQAAGVQNDTMRQNRLMQLFQEQGPGIARGDQGAIDAYARMDPQAALGVRQTRQQMNISAERLKMEREQARVAAEDRVMQMDAAEAAAQAEQLKRAIAGGLQAQTPEQWDQFVASLGADNLVGQFENRELIASQYLGIADALEQAAGPKPQDEYQRYVAEEEAAGRTPLSRIEYAQAKKGQETVYGPDGQPIYSRGPAGSAPPKLTVEAGKNTGFYLRTLDANETLNQLEQQGLDFLQQNAEAVPLGLGNYVRTPEFQKFDQARRDFVNAILRRESGAVISPEEFDNANKQYFPQPGDSPEVIAQKRRNRQNAIEGLRIGSGEGAGYVDQSRGGDGGAAPKTFDDFSAQAASDPAVQRALGEGMTLEDIWKYHPDNPENQ